MKTLQNIHSRLAAFAAVVAIVAACDHNSGSEILPSANDPAVRFSASGPVETRTSFSGVLNDSKVERIDWVSGDPITIWSDNADDHAATPSKVANYTVSSDGTASAELSKAPVTPVGGQLKWYSDGAYTNYQFWGAYPTNKVTVNAASNSFTATIPSTQELSNEHEYTTDDGTITKLEPSMEYAYMAGYLKTEKKAAEEVILPFWPAFTAFEINLKSADADFELMSFTLSSTSGPVSGGFTATWTGASNNLGGWTYAAGSSTPNSVTASFADGSGNGLAVTTTESVTFTVFALPVDLTNLKLSFGVKQADGTTKSKSIALSKDGTALTFAGAQKHRINALALPTGWNFSYITLNLEVIEWTENEETTNEYAQATQFAVTGATEATQQHWECESGSTVTLSYKVLLPTGEGTSWSIEAQGDTSDFTIEGTTSGTNIPEEGVAVTLKITPTGASGKQIYFKTYATSASGIKYSLDSETQLYDIRGYHYFTIK